MHWEMVLFRDNMVGHFGWRETALDVRSCLGEVNDEDLVYKVGAL